MPSISSDYTITVRQGTTADFQFRHTVTDAATGAFLHAVDLTGYRIRFALRVRGQVLVLDGTPQVDDPTDAVKFDLPASYSVAHVTDGLDGRWQLLLSAILTKSTLPGVHQYEIDFISSEGVVSTYAAGEFNVEKDVA